MTAWILAAILANTSVALPEVGPISGDKGAPQITDFDGNEGLDGIWTFTGTVSDPDQDPTGSTVYFYGVLGGHTATVQSNDTFSLTVDLGSAYGAAAAQTEDSNGNKSNIAVTTVH